MVTTGADARLAALYATAPSEFVRARNALAARLAEDGDPRASAVRAIPRPTVVTWILNRLARERASAVRRLLDAGERLRGAEREALRGRGGEALRGANAALGELVGRLRDEGAALLAAGGGRATADVLKRIEDGLRAAATSGGEAADRLRDGTLEREPEAEGLAAMMAVAPAREELRAAEPRAADRRAEKAATEALRRAERDAQRLARAADDAERRARDARADAEEARARAEEGRARVEERRRALEGARAPRRRGR